MLIVTPHIMLNKISDSDSMKLVLVTIRTFFSVKIHADQLLFPMRIR